MYLLDTNVVSELIKNRPHGAVTSWFQKLESNEMFLAAITVAEIQAGAEKCRRRHPEKASKLEAWLSRLVQRWQILPADAAVAIEWAKLMHGKPRTLAEDGWIIATARVYQLTIATRNTRDFEPFDVKIFNPFEDTRLSNTP